MDTDGIYKNYGVFMKRTFTKFIISILALCLSCATLFGCSNDNSGIQPDDTGNGDTEITVAYDWVATTPQTGKDTSKFYYSDGVDAEGNYDESLLYRNDMSFSTDAADPGTIYVDGYYYSFVTSDPIRCYRTKNFNEWEFVSYAFYPSADSWAENNYWAPEVIRSKTDGKYYMYYTASCKDDGIPNVANPVPGQDRMKLGVAVADKVWGPYTECRNSKNECIVFDFRIYLGVDVWATIDGHPFYDGNQLYLYFSRSFDRDHRSNEIWGVKMNSMTEPDYTSLKQLTRCVYTKVNGGEPLSFELGADVNEGAYMVKHTTERNGKTMYYLTYSIYGYTDRRYAVCVATSDSPLGDFTKLDSEFNQPLVGVAPEYDHLSGTGHCSLVESPDGEFYVFYHGHKNVIAPGARGVCVDSVVWEYNETLGYDIMHANGPTKSLQLSPKSATGWENIIKDATITFSKTPTKGNANTLKDGIVTMRVYDKEKDLVLPEGATTITIAFPTTRKIRALMVYNSYESYYAFKSIKNIKLYGATTETIGQIVFPTDYYPADGAFMRPGGAAFVEFTSNPSKKIGEGIDITKIEFTIDEKIYPTQNSAFSGIALSEIAVVGK